MILVASVNWKDERNCALGRKRAKKSVGYVKVYTSVHLSVNLCAVCANLCVWCVVWVWVCVVCKFVCCASLFCVCNLSHLYLIHHPQILFLSGKCVVKISWFSLQTVACPVGYLVAKYEGNLWSEVLCSFERVGKNSYTCIVAICIRMCMKVFDVIRNVHLLCMKCVKYVCFCSWLYKSFRCQKNRFAEMFS